MLEGVTPWEGIRIGVSSTPLLAEMVFLRYVVPVPLLWVWGREASQHYNSPAKLGIRVGNGVEPTEPGKHAGVFPSGSLTDGLKISTSHANIHDRHFVGLVALDSIWCWEVMFVVCVFNALDQPA